MVAVLFEVMLADGMQERYLEMAGRLRPLLEQIDGFISVERFQSLSTPQKLLSLSFWESEQAVRAWREQEEHRQAQQQGRDGWFADYRLRVVSVLRDYGLHDRKEAPARDQA